MSNHPADANKLAIARSVLENGGLFKDAVEASGLSRTTLHKYGITRRKVVPTWSPLSS